MDVPTNAKLRKDVNAKLDEIRELVKGIRRTLASGVESKKLDGKISFEIAPHMRDLDTANQSIKSLLG